MELQINTLAGGTTQDYTEHIKEALHDVSDVYAGYHNKSSVDARSTVVSKLKNTISDRVSVNHCARLQLEEDLNQQLLELNCNVHPSDGIASKARKTLKELVKKHNVKEDLFGTRCCADTLIYCLSKMTGPIFLTRKPFLTVKISRLADCHSHFCMEDALACLSQRLGF